MLKKIGLFVAVHAALLGGVVVSAHAAPPAKRPVISVADRACMKLVIDMYEKYVPDDQQQAPITGIQPAYLGSEDACAAEVKLSDGSFIYSTGTLEKGAIEAQSETQRRSWAVANEAKLNPPKKVAAAKPKAKAKVAAKAKPAPKVSELPSVATNATKPNIETLTVRQDPKSYTNFDRKFYGVQ